MSEHFTARTHAVSNFLMKKKREVRPRVSFSLRKLVLPGCGLTATEVVSNSASIKTHARAHKVVRAVEILRLLLD